MLEAPTIPGGGLPKDYPTTLIRARKGWAAVDLRAVWSYRELLVFLIWRDLKVRYKQTLLGASWIIIQPLLSVVVFSVVFGTFARLPSDGTPYFINAYCAMLPWTLFSGAVNRAGTSIVASSNLVSKVFFPRLVIPISAAATGLVDYAISLVVLFGVMAVMGRHPGVEVLTLPFWALLVLLLGTAVGIVLSALNVRFRDVSFMLPFLLQIWMFASPVAYSASLVPERWRLLYAFNPMVGMIQGSRWALLGSAGVAGVPWIPAVAITLLILLGGTFYFVQTERTFTDTI